MANKIPVWKQAYVGGNPAPRSHDNDVADLLIQSICGNLTGRSASAGYRVLVFSSNYDASVEISFVRPARTQTSDMCLAVVDDQRAKVLGEDGLTQLFELMRPSHVVFCRYWGDNYDLITALSETCGAATLSFLDDNLLEVPAETGASTHAFFQDETRRAIISRTITEPDLFIPSTPLLARAMEKYRPGPMSGWSIYRSLSEDEFTPDMPRRLVPTVGYMGSGSHITDVEAILPAIIALLEKRPEVRVEFFGTIKPPQELAIFGPRVSARSKADSYDDFVTRLKRLGWWVGLAPLTASTFNQTKASTKWVEYTLAGIPTLATSPEVYGKPAKNGALRLVSAENYLSAMEEMLDNPEQGQAMLAESRRLLIADYNLADHYGQLQQALKAATNLAKIRLAALQNLETDETVNA